MPQLRNTDATLYGGAMPILRMILVCGLFSAALPASADAQPAPGKKPSCFAGRVVTVALTATTGPGSLEFTIDPGPMGSYNTFQGGAAPAETISGWASMLTQAYLQNAIVTVQYGDPVTRQPQAVTAITLSHNAISNCTYRSPLPPIVSLQH